jgi:4-amino-4-deoxy-L-arabinose transferase-like glycosyltransferase
LALLLLAGLVQFLTGAYEADFWEYDESAHFVSALAVHDYLHSSFWSNPVEFARTFQEHYPKVAIGHWPPAFHIALGAWMLIFSTATGPVLSFLALVSAITAWIVYRMWRTYTAPVLAAGAGAAYLVLPLIRGYLASVMTEVFLALLVVLSALLAERLLERGSAGAGAAFGLAASLAILTKANGWALPLMLVLALAATRRFHLLLRPGIWVSGAIVAAVCLPWYLTTLPQAQAGWTGSTNIKFLTTSVAWFNLSRPAFSLGVVLTVFTLIGLIRRSAMLWKGSLDTRWACALATIAAFWIFHTFVAPVREARHSIYSLPFLLGFAADGVAWTVTWAKARFPGRVAVAWAIPALVVVAFLAEKGRAPRKLNYHSIPAAEWVLNHMGQHPTKMLVSSHSRGESAFIASLAQRDLRPRHTIVRGTQSLAWTQWASQGYRQVLKTEEEILEYLEQHAIELVLFDTTPPLAQPKPHHSLLGEVIQARGDRFFRAAQAGCFEVWEFRRAK